MKTLKDYIYNIREDWEEDLDQSKLHFFPKNEKELKETFDCLIGAKQTTDITDWLVAAMYNYAQNTNSNEVYYGRDIFDDATGQWFKYSNMHLIALNGHATEKTIKSECGKDASPIMSRVCLAYLYESKCKIAVFTIDKLDKGANVTKEADISDNMTYDYTKSFGENITYFLDEAQIIGKRENKAKKNTVENPAVNAAKEHTGEIKDELKNLGLDKEIFQKVANKLTNLVLSESINEAKISAKEVRQMVAQMREKDKEHIDMVLTNLFLVWEKIKMLGLKSPDNVRALLSAYEKSPEEKIAK